MKVIDGSQGEGGGQIFRTSLTLAMCLGQTVRIENIRAGRRKPGLLRQHLTCLRAAQEICNAEVSGDELGSGTVSFKPGTVKPGEYKFSIGSAGSSTLVFQTVFMPLVLAGGVSELVLEGGTHNGMAPSFDFIEHSFLPQMKKMGIHADVELDQFGFYPAGGGAWRARIHPADQIKPLDLMARGKLLGQTAVATSSRIPEHVTQRELDWVQQKCEWPEVDLKQRLVKSAGPGNIVSLRLQMENVTEVVEVVGERSVSAERVAGKAIAEVKRYLASEIAAGEHLADQLVLPMALGVGGSFITAKPSQHLLTNIEVISQWMPVDIQLTETNEGQWSVNISPK